MHLSAPRTRPPMQGVRLRHASPLARDLLAVYAPGVERSPLALSNLVTGVRTSVNSQGPDSLAPGPHGLAVKASGRALSGIDAGLITDLTTGRADSLTALSFLVIFKPYDAPGASGYSSPLNKNPWGINYHHGNPAYQGVFSLNVGGSWDKVAYPAPVVGAWHVWGGTWDGSTQRAYAGGREVGALARSGGMSSYPAPLVIAGAEPSGLSGGWNGEIAFVYVARRALPAAAMAALSRNPWQIFA